jgi:protoporphyrinogen/coproporphyrinogen III oxidase
MRSAIIIGGGISGLSASYYLTQAGVPATLIERQPRLGGVIQTQHIHGCILETGPDSFISIKPAAMELIRELGLAHQVIGSNDHLRVTYVWRGNRLVPLPDGLMMMIPTRIAPMITTSLLSWPTKIRMGLEWFAKAPPRRAGDRSVAEFIASHYGQEAVDFLAEPMLSGIYGGNPEVLSVNSVLPRFVELEAKYGSLTKGVLAARRNSSAASSASQGGSASSAEPIFRTLRGGLSTLVDAILEKIDGKVKIRHEGALTLERTSSGYRVTTDTEAIEAPAVVLACQAYQAASLLQGMDTELARLLDQVPYSSSLTMALGYRKQGFNHDLNGFGFLVPKKERRRLVACTWVATKFSHRVPDDQVVLRCFLGGTDEHVLDESDDALVAAVREELQEKMGVTAEPHFVSVTRWPRSMAQYTVGHEDRWKAMQQRLSQWPGLHVAGNAYTGIGIPDCIRMGKQAAAEIAGAHARTASR